jgi:hypothetical protein
MLPVGMRKRLRNRRSIIASGARVFITPLYEIQQGGAKKELVTLCVGDGMGIERHRTLGWRRLCLGATAPPQAAGCRPGRLQLVGSSKERVSGPCFLKGLLG